MKKVLFITAALALVAVSCQDAAEENLASLTDSGCAFTLSVAANSSYDEDADNQSRVAIDASGDVWCVTWAQGDDLLLYPMASGESYYQLTMADDGYGQEVSIFTCPYAAYGDYRIVHPYMAPAADDGTSGSLYQFDLSSQIEGLNNTYMVSDSLISISQDSETTGSEGFSMAHVGATLDLYVIMYDAIPDEYRLTSIKMLDVPTSITVDLAESASEDSFYQSAVYGDMVITTDDVQIDWCSTSNVTSDDILNFKFNIFPFEKSSADDLTFEFIIEDTAGKQRTITKTINADLAYVNSTYNQIYMTCSATPFISTATLYPYLSAATAGDYIGVEGYIFLSEAPYYIYCAIDQSEVDTTDTTAVGMYILTSDDAATSAEEYFSMTITTSQVIGFIPVDYNGDYGTPIIYTPGS